ncbi:hypothetical protein LGT39_12245 [Demequina sp. TTPB684]|uniref:hypothetical protein n=1 Tax=unclassified Demequina TaxID=2620311 RepID=UPI001CF5328D|nr:MULTISPECIES: hypothetical protein [unclassified Demequina]MCB2413614.1 hypothetical protein [Demequina sp. TTPB684]UPU88262.1 hypothetical protein LGT36_013630 [Demequina sp. TMPB413]
MPDVAALLDRAPEAVRRFAYRVAAGRGLLGKLADAVRFRASADQLPLLPSTTEARIRLVIGPANSAGQGYQWARAVERHVPGATAVSIRGTGTDVFQPDVDLTVPVGVYQLSKAWHADMQEFLSRQTHLVWESGLPFLGRRYESDVSREMALLAESGVRGALLFHGSDIRPPTRHAAQNPWSPFKLHTGAARTLEDTAMRNADLVARVSAPVFVSTPDLLQWLPEATWCPVVVDSARWRAAATHERSDGPLVVAHAPSHKWLKGTEHVEPVLRRLAGEGVIEYRQIVGIPHSSMPDFYARADVVLDQFVLGIYGVAACEAMAAGRLVMSHVDDFTRTQVRERTGVELPVHEVTIESLESELRRAAAEPEAFYALRSAGPDFVDRVHDGRRSAAALAPFLGLSA